MTKQKSILIALLFLFIIFGIAYFLNMPREISKPGITPGRVKEEATTSTREEVPENIVVPEPGAEVEEGIAVPQTVTEAAPGVEAKFRRFEIKAENENYIPSTIIVNKGDTVHIDFTAVDKKYDFVLPDYHMKQVAERGETKIIEFQALEQGKFLFCSELYGGLEGKMKGYIIVK